MSLAGLVDAILMTGKTSGVHPTRAARYGAARGRE